MQMRRDVQKLSERVNRILELHGTRIPQHLQITYLMALRSCKGLIAVAQEEAREWTSERIQQRFHEFCRYNEEEHERFKVLKRAMLDLTAVARAVWHAATH